MSTAELTEMIDKLTEDDLYATFKYVEFLVNSRKKKALNTLRDIQGIFENDKGWASEDDMLADMANFRRTRIV